MLISGTTLSANVEFPALVLSRHNINPCLAAAPPWQAPPLFRVDWGSLEDQVFLILCCCGGLALSSVWCGVLTRALAWPKVLQCNCYCPSCHHPGCQKLGCSQGRKLLQDADAFWHCLFFVCWPCESSSPNVETWMLRLDPAVWSTLERLA